MFNLLLEGSFADSSLVRLFTEMNPWAIALFILGALFLVVELMLPGFGFFGISGLIMLFVAIVIRMVTGGDLLMLVYMLIICAVLVCGTFLLLSKLIRKRQQNPNSLFSVQSAVPQDKTQGTQDFDYLIGMQGTTATVLRPIGKATFGTECVDVTARDGFIEIGKSVTVVSVEGQRVVVVEQ